MDVDALFASPPLASLDPDIISFLRESLAPESSPSEAAELLQPFLVDAELADEQQKLGKEHPRERNLGNHPSKGGNSSSIHLHYFGFQMFIFDGMDTDPSEREKVFIIDSKVPLGGHMRSFPGGIHWVWPPESIIAFLGSRGFQPKPSFATATGKGQPKAYSTNPARWMQKILKKQARHPKRKILRVKILQGAL